MAGHVPSIRAVLKIIVARIALLGLAVDDLDSDGTGTTAPMTVVIPPGSAPAAD